MKITQNHYINEQGVAVADTLHFQPVYDKRGYSADSLVEIEGQTYTQIGRSNAMPQGATEINEKEFNARRDEQLQKLIGRLPKATQKAVAGLPKEIQGLVI